MEWPVLDINIFSEATKPSADRAISAWLDEQVSETFCMSRITWRFINPWATA